MVRAYGCCVEQKAVRYLVRGWIPLRVEERVALTIRERKGWFRRQPALFDQRQRAVAEASPAVALLSRLQPRASSAAAYWPADSDLYRVSESPKSVLAVV